MTAPAPIVIGDQEIAPGDRREVRLKFSESYLGAALRIPIYVVRAKQAGPTLCITAVIHGDELNGMGIVRDLFYNDSPDLVRGSLIMVPVVNIPGVERHTRYMPDRRDLNRSFPGSERGSISSRLAYALYHQIIQSCDYCIDLHTAAVRRTNFPNVRGNMRDERVRRIAIAFGTELVIHSRGPKGSLRRTATEHGIPSIIIEAGEVWKIEPSVVEGGVRGCMNVMMALDMIDGEATRPLFQTIVSRTKWLRADRGGLLSFHARPGDIVHKGDPLATTQSLFGRESQLIRAPAGGIVVGMSTLPMVKPGEPIYHLALLGRRALDNVRDAIEQSPDGHLYTRLQEDLATNITVHDPE